VYNSKLYSYRPEPPTKPPKATFHHLPAEALGKVWN